MSLDHYVIIGNGAAGNRAAEILRQSDPDIRITIISDEFELYYFRHRIPGYITGQIEKQNLYVHDLPFYKSQQIRLRLGQEAVKIDFEKKVIFLKHMEKISYTRLLLCLGGKPKIPEIHYPYRHHFTTVKTLSDAQSIKERLPAIQSVFITGGDLISVRLADALRQAGREVTFLLNLDSFWPLEINRELLLEFSSSLKKKGIQIITDTSITNIQTHQNSNFTVSLANGGNISCDLIGGFFGLMPDVDFLARSGLDIDRGILVNEYLETQFPGVYCAGDCAQIYNPEIKNYWVSIGWLNALRLGETAARNMLGDLKRASVPPVSVLNVEGIQVKTSWWKDLI